MNSSALLIGWVTSGRQTVDLGSLPADTYIMRATKHCTEAFNSDGTDVVTVGTDADPDAFITSIDVSSTGYAACTLGVRAGYSSTASPIKIFYTAGGSDPSTGKCLIVIETTRTPSTP